jgi:hypothetical protein
MCRRGGDTPPAREKKMDAGTMIRTAVVLFALAGAGGLVMAAVRFSGRPHPPTWLAMLHGFISAAALTLLLYVAIVVGLPGMAWLAIALLVLAAGGGVLMNLKYHWAHQALPVPLVLAHAGLAVLALALLFVSAWNLR